MPNTLWSAKFIEDAMNVVEAFHDSHLAMENGFEMKSVIHLLS